MHPSALSMHCCLHKATHLLARRAGRGPQRFGTPPACRVGGPGRNQWTQPRSRGPAHRSGPTGACPRRRCGRAARRCWRWAGPAADAATLACPRSHCRWRCAQTRRPAARSPSHLIRQQQGSRRGRPKYCRRAAPPLTPTHAMPASSALPAHPIPTRCVQCHAAQAHSPARRPSQ